MAGQSPDVVFLIDRIDSSEGDGDRKFRLRSAYRDLFDREGDDYPVQLIRNDGSLDECATALVERIHDFSFQMIVYNGSRHRSVGRS